MAKSKKKPVSRSRVAALLVILVCLMVFRQADLGMRRGQSLLALGLVFLVLAFGPRLANLAELGGELAVHGLSLLVILVLLAAVSLEVARVYGSRLPELRSKSQALDAQIQQTEKQNDVLRSDLEHEGDPDFIQGLARDDLGLASDGERIFYDVNN